MNIEDVFEERGDAGASVAYALMQLARAQERLVIAVDKCGVNTFDASGQAGALEMVGMQLKNIDDTLSEMKQNSRGSNKPCPL